MVAKTHAATKSIGCGAVTLDHYVLRHVRAGALNVDILLVDEVSQVNSAVWCNLVLCHQYGVKLILVGDLSQFSACCDLWFDQSLGEDALGRSDMLRTLVASCRLRLAENRRSDPQIFDYLMGLRVGEPDARSLEEALEDAKKRFPVRADRAPDWTIVLSHARRHQVNRQRNLALKPREGAVYCRYRPRARQQASDPQSLWVWLGCRLVGAGGKVAKGQICHVVSCTPDLVHA